MRIYDIALAVFIFNLVAYMVGSLGIFPVQPYELQSDFLSLNQTVNNQGTSLNTGNINPNDPFAAINTLFLVLKAAVSFIAAIVVVPVALAGIMAAFGVPFQIVAIVGGVTFFVYIFAVIQFFRGRGFKGDE